MYLQIKRVIDFIVSGIALLLLSPLFFVFALVLYIDDPGPIFFTQKRVGKRKRYFPIYKFRTMKTSTPKDCPTHLLDNPDSWITRLGRSLRRTSLDELPQLWNIFRGDMSIVGPRPALWNQTDLIALRDKYGANDILPGLTGWAQINGRDELPIEKKAQIDGEYVQRMGFGFDLEIFLKTFLRVLASEGVKEGKS